ncbi:MAG: hypothetical protein RIE32_10720 [Phycisphaerales bacterium]
MNHVVIKFAKIFGVLAIISIALQTCIGTALSFRAGADEANQDVEWHTVQDFMATEGAMIQIKDGEATPISGQIRATKPSVQRWLQLGDLFALLALAVLIPAAGRALPPARAKSD